MTTKTFDEIVLFARTGLNPRKNFKLGHGTNKYITIKNIHDNQLVVDNNTDVVDDEAIKLIHKRSKIKKGDVLFCSIGRLGDMYIIEDEPVGWDINESVFAFTLNEKLIRQKYFYYIFKHHKTIDYLNKNSSGSTFKSIKMNQLKKMTFELPTLDQQDEIVDILDNLSASISNKQRLIGGLDNLIKARFAEMFDGAPTKLVEEVCESFKIGPFGSALHKNEMSHEGFAFVLGTDNAVKNEFAYKEMRYINRPKYIELEKYKVEAGEVIMSMMGTVGRVAVIPDDIGAAIISSHLCILRINKQLMYPKFFHLAFCKDDRIQHQIGGIQNGSIMKGFNLKIVKAFTVKCPSLEEQKTFLDFIKQVDKLKLAVQKSLEKTQLLFDSLMQEYFG